MIYIIVFAAFLCWGSFLNVIAYRLTFDKSFFAPRSMCPICNKVISWYDNIPLVSWVLLGAKCRSCQSDISYLYPFIELVTALIHTFLFYSLLGEAFILGKFITYSIFFSALICSTRTDLEAMVIPQLFTIWLVPVGLILSWLGFTIVSFPESLVGAILGYASLWLVAKGFKMFTGKDGLGEGDMELMALVGSFLGPLGTYYSIMIGSFSGLVIGGAYLIKQKKNQPIPFGPFLSLGAVIYFFIH